MDDSTTPPDSATTAYDPTIGYRKSSDEIQEIDPLDRQSTARDESKKGDTLEKTPTQVKEVWKFRMRPSDDEEPQDWWFASTAIPLLAATMGPLANVMSIAALVTPWRNDYDPANPGVDAASIGYPDPRWCIGLNAASLACGFAGNIFLLFNFTKRIRYIIALPMTIILWYFATGILIGILVSMNRNVPPIAPDQTYSQGFWHAIIAAVLYLLSSMLLMVNMLGYFLGHYPQHFELSEEQRNLILQTMMFFFWLAGGGAVFAKVCGWAYVDALYFCDVTILTVGFGDFAAPNDTGRGLVFPFSVGGIIILGLMVSSIRRFAQEIGHDKVVKHHVERRRVDTLSRAVTTSFEAEQRSLSHKKKIKNQGERLSISAPFSPTTRTIAFEPDLEKAEHTQDKNGVDEPYVLNSPASLKTLKRSKTLTYRIMSPMSSSFKVLQPGNRKPKILILREEKDRFEAMRNIQSATKKFKQYSALMMSVIAFGLLWCVGAVVFWQAEANTQGLSYFEALYFCYVSLLTIGYGDLSPKSNAGKPFFIIWSLIAVPTMTILISDMGDTVVASYKRGTFTVADWTVLPKQGFFREFLEKHPKLLNWCKARLRARSERKRIASGFPTGPDPNAPAPAPTIEQLANEENLDEHDLARKLAHAIRETADDMRAGKQHYTYEEWVEFTRLIRFSRLQSNAAVNLEIEEEEEGLIEWDWIGPESPMMADGTEAEWLLDRLCESLDRYMKRQLPEHVKKRRKSEMEERRRSMASGEEMRSGSRESGWRRRRGSFAMNRSGERRESGQKVISMAALRMGQG